MVYQFEQLWHFVQFSQPFWIRAPEKLLSSINGEVNFEEDIPDNKDLDWYQLEMNCIILHGIYSKPLT